MARSRARELVQGDLATLANQARYAACSPCGTKRTHDPCWKALLSSWTSTPSATFSSPQVALYIRDSVEILPNLERLTQFARFHRIPVLATSCAHHPDDPELKIFPPHCMAGTAGQLRVAETACPNSVVLDVDERLGGELPLHLTLLKRELDVFSRFDGDALVDRYNQAGPTFVVYGVATDYCVAKAVEGLLKRHCRVAIVTDAIWAIDATTEADILTKFAQAGALAHGHRSSSVVNRPRCDNATLSVAGDLAKSPHSSGPVSPVALRCPAGTGSSARE